MTIETLIRRITKSEGKKKQISIALKSLGVKRAMKKAAK